MRFIQNVRITDFRSLAKVSLDGLEDSVPLVGANGSGKSNVMRALNLFFNDRVEGDQGLDLARDFREPGRQKKQLIGVEVDLAYPDDLRPELKDALRQLAQGSTEITLRKLYQREPITGFVEVEIASAATGSALVVLTDDQRRLALRLLSALRFRYVPNHVHPTALLLFEEQNIRRMLFDRLGKSKTFGDEQIKRIQTTAGELMEPIRRELQDATGEVQGVEMGTPESWKELVWTFGLKLRGRQSDPYEAAVHGSGIQSVLAYSVLHSLDSSFSGEFGWRKGAIWAIEEPESFLHASLQAALARTLAEYASGGRLQIFLTTHSPAFLGAASEGFVVEMNSTGQSEIGKHSRQDLLQVTQRAGVTPFAHPLHLGQISPLLLVEGRHDRALLRRAFAADPNPCPFEILALEDLEGNLSGGVDDIRVYLNHNRSALAARPRASPVFVLVDWEVNDSKVTAIQKSLASHPSSLCLRMHESHSNADLSQQWVGIERYLSTAFVEKAAADLGLALTTPATAAAGSWKYGIQNLKQDKSKIQQLLDTRADASDIAPLAQVSSWLSAQLKTCQLQLV